MKIKKKNYTIFYVHPTTPLTSENHDDLTSLIFVEGYGNVIITSQGSINPTSLFTLFTPFSPLPSLSPMYLS